MEIEIRGEKYFLIWNYSVQLSNLGERDVTICTLKKEGIPVASGVTVRNPKDAFVKETARKQSLRAVLKSIGLDASERKQVWDAYRSR